MVNVKYGKPFIDPVVSRHTLKPIKKRHTKKLRKQHWVDAARADLLRIKEALDKQEQTNQRPPFKLED